MLTYGERDLGRSNAFGLKRLAGRVLTVPAIGRAVEMAARRLLPTRSLHRLPVSRPRVIYRLASGEEVVLTSPRSDLIAKDLYWGEGKPTSSSECQLLLLVERLAKQCATFIDAGSYSALFAMIAAKANPLLRSVAFEIVPENYQLIVANVIENDLVGRVEPRHAGLGAERSTITMPRACNTVAQPTSLSLGSRFTSGISVPITTLAAELGDADGPFLIKIDVEGYEWAVIQGAAPLIAQHKPTMICEFLPQSAHHSEIQAFLQPLGYRFYIALDQGLEQREDIVPDADAWNWVLTTEIM